MNPSSVAFLLSVFLFSAAFITDALYELESRISDLAFLTILLGTPVLLLLVRQMEIPVSPMKVAVHRRSLRLPYSLRATGVWSGQIPFLSGS